MRAVVEAQHRNPWAERDVAATEREVLGTDHPSDVAAIFERFCAEQLGAPPTGARFYAVSVGCVLGAHLESGENVVVKASQRRWSGPFLAAVQAGQRRSGIAGIPCPVPLARPAPIVAGRSNLAVVESWIPDPGMRPGGSADARRVSAAGLARQVTSCEGLPGSESLRDHPLRAPGTELYPEPHSPLFDFESSAAGAEWIDALARRACELRQDDHGPAVVAHTDWSARNVRCDGEKLLAVYDWDSLAVVPESTAIGQAAMTWSVTADPGGTAFPTMDSVLAYIDDYEHQRARPLSSVQRRATRAAAVYVLAYSARCEHSLAAQGIARDDQSTARERLAQIGEEMLGS